MIDRLWVDDKYAPPADNQFWMWAKSAAEAIQELDECPCLSVVSLDYSLAGVGDWDNNGGEVLKWLRDHPEKWPTHEVRVHSQSASGRELLEEMAKEYAPPGWTGHVINTGGF